jgi:choline dehydrogenase-like flavoprotein
MTAIRRTPGSYASTELADGLHYDIIIVGTGMGGGTLAYALRESGARILLVDRGDFIPSEPENWDTDAVVTKARYKAADTWTSGSGELFRPGVVYAVGGNTKVYGAALPRFYRSDFNAVDHADGVSPAWPISYDDMEPFYAEAEQIYGVHGQPESGQAGDRSGPFPFPAVEHEPQIEQLAGQLSAAGYTPSHLPLGLDLQPFGGCIRCNTCDSYVCRVHAKADADVRCVRPALQHRGVEIVTNAYARRLLVGDAGARVTGIELEDHGRIVRVGADTVVVACGAVNSAVLLLHSATDRHPRGLANGSDQLGRNYMIHNNSIMLAVDPRRANRVKYQKTLYVNDFYEHGVADHPFPLGHMQVIGKVREQMVKPHAPWAPRWSRRALTNHSVDWWLFTEDLPQPNSRVELMPDGSPRVTWTPSNVRAHQILRREAKAMVNAVGYPIVIARSAGVDMNSHQAGTARAGRDPDTSVLDPDCRAHEIPNLYVVDSSFFPSLPVMNPALTIAANALRTGARILEPTRRDTA